MTSLKLIVSIQLATTTLIVGGAIGMFAITSKQDLEQTVQKTQSFPQEKILAMSTSNYAAKQNKPLSDYTRIKVFGRNNFSSGSFQYVLNSVPPKTEVVIDIVNDGTDFYGTALIPKQ